MKLKEFIYQEFKVHFLLGRDINDLMINATEMARVHNKRLSHYLKSNHAKEYIEYLSRIDNPCFGVIKNCDQVQKEPLIAPNGVSKKPFLGMNWNPGDTIKGVIEYQGKNGVYFCSKLAIDYAQTLSMEFKDWLIDNTISLVARQTQELNAVQRRRAELEALIEIKHSQLLLASEDYRDLNQALKERNKLVHKTGKALKQHRAQYYMDFSED